MAFRILVEKYSFSLWFFNFVFRPNKGVQQKDRLFWAACLNCYRSLSF